jgi:hypothetical protein
MGAHNIDFELDGKKTRQDVFKAFKERQLYDKSENGHQQGYSGDFQTVNEVIIHDKTFDNYNKAYDYCLDNAQKWCTVIAVKYKVIDKTKNKKLEEKKQAEKSTSTKWLIAGWGAC